MIPPKVYLFLNRECLLNNHDRRRPLPTSSDWQHEINAGDGDNDGITTAGLACNQAVDLRSWRGMKGGAGWLDRLPSLRGRWRQQ